MTQVMDPVCGRSVDPGHPGATTEHNGRQYVFCSEECRRIFDDNPEECLSSPPPGEKDEALPMHKGRIDHGRGW